MDTRTIVIITLSLLLLMAIAISGYFYWQLETQPDPFPIPEPIRIAQENPQPADGSERFDVFFLTPDHSQLIKETRMSLRSSVINERIRKALEELLNPQKISSNLIAPIPAGTKLQCIFWNELDGRVYVSFSNELIVNAPGNTLDEWAIIYSIVNTVAAQSVAIKDVQILVDGNVVNAPSLNWDWSRPFQSDQTFVQYTAIQDEEK